jgi:L-alanine-DL-glutamate epimerase-like enolase superfamily enzyme
MKVTSVTAIAVSIPRLKPFKSSLGIHTYSENAVVEITTDEGITGFGEAASVWDRKGRGEADFINDALADVVVGTNPFRINETVALMNQRLHQAWPAKAGIEMALFDIVGKAVDRPVYDLLGGCVRDRVMVCRSLPIGPVEDVVDQARRLAAEGYKTLKAKLGLDPVAEVAIVASLREALPDLILRVDANMSWGSAKDAVRVIRDLEEFDLEMVEQPLPGHDLDGMRFVRESVEVPIMADESMWTPRDALACIKADAADIFNVYVAEAGGIGPAAAVFSLAEAAGIPCMIGSMPEFGIGTAAQAHLAFAMRNIGFACDLNGFTYHSDDVCEHGLRIEDGYLYPPRGPGLGIEIDRARVDQYRVA